MRVNEDFSFMGTVFYGSNPDNCERDNSKKGHLQPIYPTLPFVQINIARSPLIFWNGAVADFCYLTPPSLKDLISKGLHLKESPVPVRVKHFYSNLSTFFWKIQYYTIQYLILLPVVFNPQIPQKAAGMRILPPTSVPMPRMDPPLLMRAASPPEEPPGLLVWSRGCTVWPKIRLLQSKLKKENRNKNHQSRIPHSLCICMSHFPNPT